jgi:hypothetical protein
MINMKKFFAFLFCLVSLNAFAQSSKWFFSVAPGYAIGGPSASIRHQMVQQGFDETSSYNFFGLTGTNNYPTRTWNASILVRAGVKMTERRSLYFVAGLADRSKVTGFKNEGYGDLLGILGSSYGPMPTISYSVYQLTAGYMYASARSRAKLGLGPSLFLFNYSMNNGEKHGALVPGASFTGRFPFGKERRLFGVELVLEANLAPPVKMKTGQTDEKSFHPGKANMISMNLGVAFSFRKK